MSIRQSNTEQVTVSREVFQNTVLGVFRQAPYKFKLSGLNSVSSPFSVYVNEDNSKEGARDLIEYIKNLAISQTESWNDDQLLAASQAQSIFIVYNSYNDIFLNFSSNILALDDLMLRYQSAEKLILSYDTSDLGLIELVDSIIAYMESPLEGLNNQEGVLGEIIGAIL